MAGTEIEGREHWAQKGDVRLFLWRKCDTARRSALGTIIFVHGSSMSAVPTFDLQVPGMPFSSSMDWFATQGFDTWCVDMEGYGRSDKTRAINADIPTRRRRSGGGVQLYRSADGGQDRRSLRHILRVLARRPVCPTPARTSAPPGARRVRMDRRGQPDAGAAQEEIAAIQGGTAPADRLGLRARHLRPRPRRVRRRRRG